MMWYRRSFFSISALLPIALCIAVTMASGGACLGQGSGWINCTGTVGVGEWSKPGVTRVACRSGADEVVAAVAHVGIYISRDGGATWVHKGGKGQVNHLTYQIQFDPQNTRRMWLNGHYGHGVYKTTDDGDTFEPLGNITHVDCLGIDFTDPDRRTMLLGMHEQGNKLYLSVSGGRTWRLITDNLPPLTGSTPNNAVIDGNTYMLQNTGGALAGILRTTDGGRTWTRVCDQSPDQPPLITSRGIIYWKAADGGLLRSTDRGATWVHIPSPANTCPIEASGLIVCVGNRQLYASKNGGATWGTLGPPMPFAPAGVAYNNVRKAFYIWRMTLEPTSSAIYRWKP